MRVARGRSGEPSERRGGTFTGSVWVDSMLRPEAGVAVNAVFFEPGSRSHWHIHSGGQILHVAHGEGLVQRRGDEPIRICAGDVVHIAGGEEHWHGATHASYMLHHVVTLGDVTWLEAVGEAEYAAPSRAVS